MKENILKNGNKDKDEEVDHSKDEEYFDDQQAAV